MALEIKFKTTKPLEGNIRFNVTLCFVIRFKLQKQNRLLLNMSQRRYLLSPSSCYPSWWGFFCPFSSLCQGSDQ